MLSRSDSTTRSAVRMSCGASREPGRRSDRNRSRAGRACRATDRSIEIEVVQDPGGRRERPSGSREPPERSGRTTPHLRHVPGGAFHVSPSECDAIVRRARRRARRRERRRCLTTDGPGRSAVQQHRGAPSAGVAWCNGQRTHATPAARRTRCSVAPPAHHTRGYSSTARASGCRPEGCGFESRWSRSHERLSSPSCARAVPHSPRAGGAKSREPQHLPS